MRVVLFILFYFLNNLCADVTISGDITSDAHNTGTIVSVAGAEFRLGGILGGISIEVGDSKDTITNVNTIIIKGKSSVHNVNLKATNSGKIVNVGSKLNVNSIIIGD